MTQRINISISDELHDRLQVFKDDINVSNICQKAITEIVERKEDFRKRMKESPEMESTLERLKKQKYGNQGILLKRGEKDGEEWAKIAHYDELVAAVEEIPSNYDDGSWGPEFVEDQYILEYLYEKYSIRTHDPEAIVRLYLEKALPEVKIYDHNHLQIEWTYQRGLWAGILNFWNEIKDKI